LFRIIGGSVNVDLCAYRWLEPAIIEILGFHYFLFFLEFSADMIERYCFRISSPAMLRAEYLF